MAAGDASHDELFGAVERAFGWWPTEAGRCAWQATGAEAIAAPAPALPTARLAIVDRPGAAQSELRIGQVAVPRLTPDYYALLVLNMVLGGQFVSRLNMNLREDKGYTYGARSSFEFRRAPGPFGCRRRADRRDRRRGEGSPERSRRHRERATDDAGGTRPGPVGADARLRAELRDVRQIARGLAQLALYELPDDTLEQFVPSIHAVTIEAVTAAAGRLDPGRMTVCVVGDRARSNPGWRPWGSANRSCWESTTESSSALEFVLRLRSGPSAGYFTSVTGHTRRPT